MKSYERIYVIICVIFFVFAFILAYLGYCYNRLPEILIVIGCLFLLITIVYLLQVWMKVSDRDITIAQAGRPFVKVDCLCKFDKHMFQANISLCKHGVILMGDYIDYSIITYDMLSVQCISRFTMNFIYDEDKQKQKHVFQLTMNSPLEIKAVLQMLEQQHVSVVKL